ncbi:MAG: tetratricopeptide repeat protein [Myxococcota bacterium]
MAFVGPSTDEQAQERYQAGLEAFEAGRFTEAATAFEEAFELAGDPTLLYNVSFAYEKDGQLDKALEALEQYAELAPESERDEIERRRKALTLRIDKSQQEAEHEEPDDDVSSPAPVEPTKTRREPGRDKPVPDRVLTPVAISMVSLSVVALGVGMGLAIPAARADDEVERECVEQGGARLCQDTNADLVKRRRNLALGADISFAIGAAAGVAAIAILATNATRIRRARRNATSVSLLGGPTTAGVSLTTRF